jgi:hypothetical protein
MIIFFSRKNIDEYLQESGINKRTERIRQIDGKIYHFTGVNMSNETCYNNLK